LSALKKLQVTSYCGYKKGDPCGGAADRLSIFVPRKDRRGIEGFDEVNADSAKFLGEAKKEQEPTS